MDLDDDELKATRKAKGLEKIADEMLNKEGYNQIDKSTEKHKKYWKEEGFFENELNESLEIWIDHKYDSIIFYKDKIVVCFNLDFRKVHAECYVGLTLSEIRAINKKCEELGWM